MKKRFIKFIVKAVIVIAALLAAATVADGFFNKFGFFKDIFKHELSIDKTANVITQIKKISEFTTACYYEEQVIQKDKYDYTEKKVYDKSASDENRRNIKETASSALGKVKGVVGKATKAVKENEDTTTKGKLASVANAAKDIAIASGKAAVEMTADAAPELVNLAKKDNVEIDSTKVGHIVFIVKTKVRAGFNLSKIGNDDLSVKGDTLSIKLPEAEIFDIIANPSDWENYDSEGEWEDSEIRAIQANAKEEIRKDAIEYGILEKAASFGRESLVSLFKTFGFAEVILL